MDGPRSEGYNGNMPTLYIVATPIGNLEDISRRALRILGEVALIAAEDTRRTRHLLTAYGLKTPLISYHDHNKEARLPYLLSRLEKEDIALVSEAGTPGISDPGYELVVAALEHGMAVVPIPGPSAVPAALAVSGLPAHQFLYLGFLPRRKAERQRLLQSIAQEPRTIVAFEAPHRLSAALRDLLQILGDRRLAVCRELTKVHEEVFRGRVSQALAHFSQPRGEFTLVIAGGEEEERPERGELAEELDRLRRQGLKAREAVSRVAAATGLPRREVYRAWLKLS